MHESPPHESPMHASPGNESPMNGSPMNGSPMHESPLHDSRTAESHGAKSTSRPDVIPRVAFQGEAGAFSELAIQQQWPLGALPIPCISFETALALLVDGVADFAMLPVENRIAGVVHSAVSALDAHSLHIATCAETRLPIHLCLLALPSVTLHELCVVRSHPIALQQCGLFLARHPWLMPIAHDDTAGAARDLRANGIRSDGAVASEAAALCYGLDIVARHVEDVPDNWTRFVVVRRR